MENYVGFTDIPKTDSGFGTLTVSLVSYGGILYSFVLDATDQRARLYTSRNGTVWSGGNIIVDTPPVEGFEVCPVKAKNKWYATSDGIGKQTHVFSSPDLRSWTFIQTLPIYHGKLHAFPRFSSTYPTEEPTYYERFQIWGGDTILDEEILIYETKDFRRIKLVSSINNSQLTGIYSNIWVPSYAPVKVSYANKRFLICGGARDAAFSKYKVIGFSSKNGYDWKIGDIFEGATGTWQDLCFVNWIEKIDGKFYLNYTGVDGTWANTYSAFLCSNNGVSWDDLGKHELQNYGVILYPTYFKGKWRFTTMDQLLWTCGYAYSRKAFTDSIIG